MTARCIDGVWSHRSPLEGEQAKQGRQPEVEWWGVRAGDYSNLPVSSLFMSIVHTFPRLLPLAAALLWLAACTVNPVTGRNQLMLISESEELDIGRQNYAPLQQSEGGVYRLDPGLSDYVSEVGQRVAAVSDRPLDYEFVVLNNSVPNAWALPGGKIGINRGLLYELDSEAELAAVLGHEVVHAAARHGAAAMSRSALLEGAVVLGAVAAQDHEYEDYIVSAARLGAVLVGLRYGRDAERESDEYGIRYMLRAGYDPQAAVSLQEAFLRLSEGREPGWLAGLFASHPPSSQRVEDNQALVIELQPETEGLDLETGQARYRQAMAGLTATRPAYEFFDEAEAAFASRESSEALGHIEEAIGMLPREARFHGLKADVLRYEGRYREAVRSYDRALGLDDGYYEYYLGRGLSMLQLNRRGDAQRDFSRSTALLPTALAANELGKLALAAGERSTAKRHFSDAAGAGGRLGEEAYDSFVRLDLMDNPASYLQAEAFADKERRIYVRVSNHSPVTVVQAAVTVEAVLGRRTAQRDLIVPELPPETYRDMDSGLVFPEGSVMDDDMMAAWVNSATP